MLPNFTDFAEAQSSKILQNIIKFVLAVYADSLEEVMTSSALLGDQVSSSDCTCMHMMGTSVKPRHKYMGAGVLLDSPV